MTPTIHTVTHHFVTVHDRRVFYREAGDPSLPTIILLHGFPASSFMFRNLIPHLAGYFHVIAPDYIGLASRKRRRWAISTTASTT